MDYNGELFLDILYQDLYRNLADSYKQNGKTKQESIKKYLNLIEEIHRRAKNPKHNKNELVKQQYYDKYVIKKENIPSSISDKDKDLIITAQKESLGMWIDYLTDDNTKYPMWAKYWVFQQMLRLGTYDDIDRKYLKRTKKTLDSFVEVNPEIVTKCIENIIELLGTKKLNNQQIRKKIGDLSFERMYIEYGKKRNIHIKSNEGKWVKYNYGNIKDAALLAKSLYGYNTKWCTANEVYAMKQLCGGMGYSGGDFYVYYSKDENNEYKIPRIAIRLNGNKTVAEIRGVAENQNVEEEMLSVLETKLNEMTFLNRNTKKRSLEIINNLKELALIKQKVIDCIPLSIQEIINLYTKKYGFGTNQDPLVFKIAKKRNIMNDFRVILYYKDDYQICLSLIEFLSKSGVLISDKYVALQMLRLSSRTLYYINPKMEEFKEIVMKEVQYNADSIIHVNPEIDNYKEIVVEAVRYNAKSIIYINPSIENYKDVVCEAVLQNIEAIIYVYPEEEGYMEIVMRVARKNDKVLDYIEPELKKEIQQRIKNGSNENAEKGQKK